MGKNEFLKQRDDRDRKMLLAGMNLGMQAATDYMQIALRDKEVMGKDTFGRKRIDKILRKIMELDDQFSVAYSGAVDADYYQEKMDAILREVWGDDLLPFYKRYPDLKQHDYSKARKGWR
jgi:hypothetical protein